MNFSIDSAHFLAVDGKPVRRDIIAGGSPMQIRRALVIHFTGGATAQSSITAMRERGVSAHIVIDRDGTITQCRQFNTTAGHAGVSRWVDPKTGTKYTGCNECTIGIELANAGDDTAALKWAKRNGFDTGFAAHRNEPGKTREWEQYAPLQIAVLKGLSKALVERYKLDDITGHDCVAPERKLDPGPLFPMEELRKHCGFSGLPEVHRQ